jgi:hypothetical protein
MIYHTRDSDNGRKKRDKPPKPHKGFPLTAHDNGQWCKKIRGKLHYFGPWGDWQAALAVFREPREDLYAAASCLRPLAAARSTALVRSLMT